ncbi:MAG: polyphosphate kinase 2 (PPK2 family) [Oleiphilaceae bacterium]|jgi:polyphosphate kinase 2 (PPK2 family)
MQSSSSPIIIIIEGVDNVVKGEVVNRLNEWFDTRSLDVFAFAQKTQEEAERPKLCLHMSKNYHEKSFSDFKKS